MTYAKKKIIKKAFTLVELLVVIAILAILGTVGVIGYTSFIGKAHLSNDQTVISELNTFIKAADVVDEIHTVTEANEALKEDGFDLTKLKPSSKNYRYAYDVKQKEFCLIDGDWNLVDYECENKVDVFAFIDNESNLIDVNNNLANHDYSSYLQADFPTSVTTLVTDKGIDTGVNNTVKDITYKNTSNGQDVVICTNRFATKLTVDGKTGDLNVGDEVSHYGYAYLVDVKGVANASYYEYGIVGRLKITAGHIVAKDGSEVFCLMEVVDGAIDTTVETGATVHEQITNLNAEGSITKETDGVGTGFIKPCENHDIVSMAKKISDSEHEYYVCKTCGHVLKRNGTVCTIGSDNEVSPENIKYLGIDLDENEIDMSDYFVIDSKEKWKEAPSKSQQYFKVTKDFELSGDYTMVIDRDEPMLIDMQGHTVTGSGSNGAISNSGTLILENGSLDTSSNTDQNCINNKGTMTLSNINIDAYRYGVKNGVYDYWNDINISGSLELQNCEINSTGKYNFHNDYEDADFVYAYQAVYNENGSVVIYSGTYSSTYADAIYSSSASMTVYAGTFITPIEADGVAWKGYAPVGYMAPEVGIESVTDDAVNETRTIVVKERVDVQNEFVAECTMELGGGETKYYASLMNAIATFITSGESGTITLLPGYGNVSHANDKYYLASIQLAELDESLTFDLKGQNLQIDVPLYIGDNVTFKLNGGNVTLGSGGYIDISGGTFDFDPTEYVDSGYDISHNEDNGTWTVTSSDVGDDPNSGEQTGNVVEGFTDTDPGEIEGYTVKEIIDKTWGITTSYLIIKNEHLNDKYEIIDGCYTRNYILEGSLDGLLAAEYVEVESNLDFSNMCYYHHVVKKDNTCSANGTIYIRRGTYNWDPSDFILNDYQVIQNGTSYSVVETGYGNGNHQDDYMTYTNYDKTYLYGGKHDWDPNSKIENTEDYTVIEKNGYWYILNSSNVITENGEKKIRDSDANYSSGSIEAGGKNICGVYDWNPKDIGVGSDYKVQVRKVNNIPYYRVVHKDTAKEIRSSNTNELIWSDL